MNMKTSEPRLGIDIGRVIIAPAAPGTRHDTSFLGGSMKHALATPAVEGALSSIAELVDIFEGRVWLVSTAGENVRSKTRAWLSHMNFFEKTGIPSDHLRFCRKRRQKAGHCRELGLTHFIDDRVQVLTHLRNLVPHLYLFGPQEEGEQNFDWLCPVWNWQEVSEEMIL